jgi:cytochrome P450
VCAGFLIPKGWKVMPLFSNLHYSPDYFEDPHKFDPSRFKVINGWMMIAWHWHDVSASSIACYYY